MIIRFITGGEWMGIEMQRDDYEDMMKVNQSDGNKEYE